MPVINDGSNNVRRRPQRRQYSDFDNLLKLITYYAVTLTYFCCISINEYTVQNLYSSISRKKIRNMEKVLPEVNAVDRSSMQAAIAKLSEILTNIAVNLGASKCIWIVSTSRTF